MFDNEKHLVPARHRRYRWSLVALALLCVTTAWLGVTAIADGEEAPDPSIPATVQQIWPPVAADGSVDDSHPEENPWHDQPGGTDEPLRVWKMTPPMTSSNGKISVPKICDIHLIIMKADGSGPDPKAEPNASEYRFKEKKKGKPRQDNNPRWQSKSKKGRIIWYNKSCKDPMPPQGFHLIAWGKAGDKKTKEYRPVTFKLTNSGEPDIPPPPPTIVPPSGPTTPGGGGGQEPPPITEDPEGHPFRIDIIAAYHEPGSGMEEDPRNHRGVLCQIGTTGVIALQSADEDALAAYETDSSLSLDLGSADPSQLGIHATTDPVPAAWGLVWQDLAGSLDPDARAELSVTVPPDPQLALRSFYVVSVTQPNQPPDEGNITIQTMVTLVHSFADYDGDGELNEDDETPFGE